MFLRFRGSQVREPTLSGTTPPSSLSTSAPPNPSPSAKQPSSPQAPAPSVSFHRSPAYEAWQQSRGTQDGNPGVPSSHRAVNLKNLALAFQAIRFSAVDLFVLLWGIHPVRMTILLILNLFRGTLPAIRCYSQALLLDEAQTAVACHSITERLVWLVLLEILRMLGEQLFEHFATRNESLVQQNVRFRVEYLQMETQLRLDIPSLSDPEVQDLLTEADAFARSFSGMGGLGLLSPFDLIRTLTTIVSELLSQSYILWTLMVGSASSSGDRRLPWSLDATQLMVLGSALLPTALSLLNSMWTRFYSKYADETWARSLYNPEESAAAEQHERMRRLAYDGSFKSEILLFGLADWILQTWADTRRIMMQMKDTPKSNAHLVTEFVDSSARELFSTLQAIPLIVQLSTTSLGSVTLYRTTVQTILASLRNLSQTFQMTFQGIFLMAAFHAALNLRPIMEPKGEPVPYQTMTGERGRKGMKIEARNLSFTYPGSSEPAIRNLNLSIQPGETVAVVGHNGGGKTTLMHLLLRLYEYDNDGGQLLINGVDARQYSAADLHSHSSGVFQGFSRLTNASVRENTGIGCVTRLQEDESIKTALKEAGALDLVENSMSNGIDTKLDAGGFRSHSQSPTALSDPRHYRRRHLGDYDHRGRLTATGERFPLSGGQWQRVAISRSFMRPDADLVVLDEASSQLDAHAQNEIFNNVTKNAGQKTVIYITHRLSTVRWADKIAFFDKGTITEFGTHEELMLLNGSYASLYNAFMTTGSSTPIPLSTRA